MSQPITTEKLLLVEGKDELNGYVGLRDMLGLDGIDIRVFDGTENLKGVLRGLPSVEGFRGLVSLGIVRDAEEDYKRALQRVQSALGNAGLPVPEKALAPKGEKPRVVFLINPDGKASGSLDDVCVESVKGDSRMECVELFVDCLERIGKKPKKVAKTRSQAFIASCEQPELSLGVAMKAGYFPLNDAAFEPARRLLTML